MFATASYYLPTRSRGSHDLKAGFEWLDDGGSSGATGKSGAIQYLDSNGQTNQVRLYRCRRRPNTFGDTLAAVNRRQPAPGALRAGPLGVTDRLTVTAGLRYDRQTPYYEESRRAPVLSDVFAAVGHDRPRAARAQHLRATRRRAVRPDRQRPVDA